MGDSTAKLIPDTLYKAMMPRLIPYAVPQDTKWYIDDIVIESQETKFRVMMALKLQATEWRAPLTHWSKYNKFDRDKGEKERQNPIRKLAIKYGCRSIRLAYYKDDEFPPLGFLHTYFFGNSWKKSFHVFSDRKTFPINRITKEDLENFGFEENSDYSTDLDYPLGFYYRCFYKGSKAPRPGTDRYNAVVEHIKKEASYLQEAWENSNNGENNFGRFLCAYMYFRNHELASTKPSTNNLCKRLINPRSMHELNLRLTLSPGYGAPPIKR